MTMPPNNPSGRPLGRDHDVPPSPMPNPPVRKTKNWLMEHWWVMVIAAVVLIILLGWIGSEHQWFTPHDAVTTG